MSEFDTAKVVCEECLSRVRGRAITKIHYSMQSAYDVVKIRCGCSRERIMRRNGLDVLKSGQPYFLKSVAVAFDDGPLNWQLDSYAALVEASMGITVDESQAKVILYMLGTRPEFDDPSELEHMSLALMNAYQVLSGKSANSDEVVPGT